MRFKFVTLMIIASCLPAVAEPLASQGSISVVRGRAHVEEGALGTYIEIERPGSTRSVAGFIPFGDEPTFPAMSDIDGRIVEIGGVVAMDGRVLIVMTDPDQLAVVS